MGVVALGFLIAAAIGITGVGGGVLTAPLLILWLGLPAAEAVGTALLFVTAVKALAAAAYLVRGQVDGRVLGRLLAGGIPGVIAGSLLLQRANSEGLGSLVLTVVGLTVLVSASLSFLRTVSSQLRTGTRDRLWTLPMLGGAIAMEVGFSSAGAGALGTLVLLQFTRLTAAEVVGTDLLFGLVVSAIGGGLHLAGGHLNPGVLIQLISGGLVGIWAGVYFSSRIPARLLRLVISGCCALLGAQLCYRGFWSLAPLVLASGH